MQQPARFERRIASVTAMEFTGYNFVDVDRFAGGRFQLRPHAEQTPTGGRIWMLDTPSGPVPVEPGDWVAQNPTDATDFYPIKPEQFDKLYDPTPLPL